MAVDRSQLQLPMSIVGYSDVGHLLTEAEKVDNFLRQSAIRETGTPMQLPKTSKLFEELVTTNNLNLLEVNDRTMLLNLLKAVRAKAPVMHMSFNSDPSPMFLQRLITWMRLELHPFVLLQIGLNPSIGAGCVVRTTNRFFDFSLRQQFTEQRDLLISKLREGRDVAVAHTSVPPGSVLTGVADKPSKTELPAVVAVPQSPAESQAVTLSDETASSTEALTGQPSADGAEPIAVQTTVHAKEMRP